MNTIFKLFIWWVVIDYSRWLYSIYGHKFDSSQRKSLLYIILLLLVSLGFYPVSLILRILKTIALIFTTILKSILEIIVLMLELIAPLYSNIKEEETEKQKA